MRPPRQSATRRDVARRAGVSDAVVSYVVNDGPRPVSPGTRRRVLDAIEELGYRPNAAARALKLARTNTIGLLVRDNANPFFAEFATALEDAAFSRGYAVLLGNSSGDPAREHAYIQAFLDRAVDGLVIIGVSQDPRLGDVAEQGTPLVVLDEVGGETDVISVLVENEAGARTGTEHLLWHGHERVACIAGPPGIAASDQRLRGWESAFSSGATPRRQLVVRTDFTREGGRVGTLELMSRDAPPTALFVSSDIQAVGALRALDRMGLRVPEDVAVVSFDGTVESAYTRPPLTVVQQPLRLMAERSVEALFSTEPERSLIPVSLVRRDSCGCGAVAATD